MSAVVCEARTTIAVPRAAAFARVVPIDLPSVFRGFGPLPAIVAVTDQTGSWDAVGQTRTIRLSDGSEAQEALTDYDRPRYFAYRVSDLTGPVRFLTTAARGEWWFEDVPGGATAIRWRYAFEPRSPLARPVLWAVARPLWQGYMYAVLRAIKEQVEAAA